MWQSIFPSSAVPHKGAHSLDKEDCTTDSGNVITTLWLGTAAVVDRAEKAKCRVCLQFFSSSFTRIESVKYTPSSEQDKKDARRRYNTKKVNSFCPDLHTAVPFSSSHGPVCFCRGQHYIPLSSAPHLPFVSTADRPTTRIGNLYVRRPICRHQQKPIQWTVGLSRYRVAVAF
jgi:hypothetical protein